MDDVQNPSADQQLPQTTPQSQPVQERMIQSITTFVADEAWDLRMAVGNAVRARREYGIRKYGQPLMTHSGRDALLDMWEEALDLWSYATQYYMEQEESGYAFHFAHSIALQAGDMFARLTRQRMRRGDDLELAPLASAENIITGVVKPTARGCDCQAHRGMYFGACCGCNNRFQPHVFTGKDYPVPRSCSCSCHRPCGE